MTLGDLPLGDCGCAGDADGLSTALGSRYGVIWSRADEHGYGHHSREAVIAAGDGSYIHAECGGCSCGGSGSWKTLPSLDEALTYLPIEQRRDAVDDLKARGLLMRRPTHDCFTFPIHRELPDGTEREYIVDARVSIGGGTIDCTVSLDGKVLKKDELAEHGLDAHDVMILAWDRAADLAIAADHESGREW